VDYRVVTNNPARMGDMSGGVATRGWYMDLPIAGERVPFAPIVRNGRVIFMTYAPSGGGNSCTAGGEGWLMELNALTGGELDNPALDINGDGVITPSDKVTFNNQQKVPGGRKFSGLTPAPTIIKGKPGTEHKIFSSGLQSILESNLEKSGRLSWREIAN